MLSLRNLLGVLASTVIAVWLVGATMHLQAASPYFVATTGNDTNDCLALPTACRTIEAALVKASGGDIVIIADGIYTEHLTLDKDITLIGFGQDVTTISGGGAGRVITVSEGVSADVSNVTIAEGMDDKAAGVYISGTLRLSRVTLTAHHSNAIFNSGNLWGTALTVRNSDYIGLFSRGVATVSHSTFNSGQTGIMNYGTFQLSGSHVTTNTMLGLPGGGISNYGIMTINGSVIRGNTVLAESGGGVYNAGRLWVNNTVIISNTAWSPPPPFGNVDPDAVTHSWGGGISNYVTGLLTVTNSIVVSNSASTGGDQVANFGTAQFTNVTLSGDNGHGGIASGYLTLMNVTISDMPSGIGVSPLVVANNTIINNTYCSAMMTSLGHNLDSGNTCGFTAGGDLTNTNPLLGPLQDNGGLTPTYALLPGSPAINAGDHANCPTTDQRGIARPQAGRCDIGAYEFVFPLQLRLPFVAR